MHKINGKLVLSTREFYHVIERENIVYCQSQNTYTTFYLSDGQEIKVSVPIKTVEQQLGSNNFIRPHQSYLVNVQHIRSIQKSSGGDLILDNGKTIAISSRKKVRYYTCWEILNGFKYKAFGFTFCTYVCKSFP